MELKGLVIDQYGICQRLRLDALSPQLNIIHGGNGSGKSTVRRFIRNLICDDGDGVPGQGHLLVNQAGQTIRLDYSSTASAGQTGQFLDAAGIAIGQATWEPIDRERFDVIYNFDVTHLDDKAARLPAVLHHRMGLPIGSLAWGNEAEYEVRFRELERLREQLELAQRRLSDLQRQRAELGARLDNERRSAARRSELEREIALLGEQLQALDTRELNEQIHALDNELSALRLRLENAQRERQKVTVIPQDDPLPGLYMTLDDIDEQIRRWQRIQADVQTYRLALRDEMNEWTRTTIESDRHPYHDVLRVIRNLEIRVNETEAHGRRIAALTVNSDNRGQLEADQVISNCDAMRQAVQQICDELERQFTQIRHRAAADELKRLRHLYGEISENLEYLASRRNAILHRIQSFDPTGAEWIRRNDAEFYQCAMSHGYIEARRRFIGELPTPAPVACSVPQPDLNLIETRLVELERQRQGRVQQLVEMENRIRGIEARREELIRQRDAWSALDTMALERDRQTVDAEIEAVTAEIQSVQRKLEDGRSIPRVAPHPLIVRAAELAKLLTCGEVDRVGLEWIAADRLGIVATIRTGQTMPYQSLGSTTRQQVLLALCLAAAEIRAAQGERLPMLLDDIWVNLDPHRIQSTCQVVWESSRRGVQMIALTAERSCRIWFQDRDVPVFELPETGVTDLPGYPSERLPSLPPYPTRDALSVSSTLLKEQTTDAWASHSRTSLPSPPDGVSLSPVDVSPRVSSEPTTDDFEFESSAPFDEAVRLSALSWLESEAATRLAECGVLTVADLLDVDPAAVPEPILARGITIEQINQWQGIAWMMICVPGMTPTDAAYLFDAGITEPEQLDALSTTELQQRLQRYATASSSRRWLDSARDRMSRWYAALGRTRSRWRSESGYSRRRRARSATSRNRYERTRSGSRYRRDESQRDRQRGRVQERERERSHSEENLRFPRRAGTHRSRSADTFASETRQSSRTRSTESNGANKSSRQSSADDQSRLKFYLNMSDSVEAAPSIGPKTAERFEKIGVRTVAEFLQQTAESMAEKLNYKRITANIIRQWQHQARLVCRIPNLRGHDAQLLVACDITDPDRLAAMDPQQLFAIIGPFSETKEGLKIIRNGKEPDLDEIRDWINWAKQTRSMQAA